MHLTQNFIKHKSVVSDEWWDREKDRGSVCVRHQIHSKSGLNQKNVQFLGALWLFVSKAKINDFKKKLRMEQIGIITFSNLQLIFLCTTFLHFLVHIPAQFHKSANCLHKNRKLLQVVHIPNQRLWIMSFCAGRHTLLSKFPELQLIGYV